MLKDAVYDRCLGGAVVRNTLSQSPHDVPVDLIGGTHSSSVYINHHHLVLAHRRSSVGAVSCLFR